jgi:sulfite reductase beta subunit-like hemoprotein
MKRSDAVRKMTGLTIMLPGGIVPPGILARVSELADEYGFGVYLSTAQNLRLINIPEEHLEAVRSALADAGAVFKGPGRFPLARVCIGAVNCNLGIVDTIALARRIHERFGGREKVKPKFKIAVSGCPAACSGAMLTDIGIVATRSGFDLYAGGKGGPRPKTGRRIGRGMDEAALLDAIEALVDFHDRKTGKKQRFARLLDDPGFPFAEV